MFGYWRDLVFAQVQELEIQWGFVALAVVDTFEVEMQVGKEFAAVADNNPVEEWEAVQ